MTFFELEVQIGLCQHIGDTWVETSCGSDEALSLKPESAMCTELAASCHKRQIFSVFRAIQSHSDVRMGVKILRNLANFCENSSQRLLHCESSCAFRSILMGKGPVPHQQSEKDRARRSVWVGYRPGPTVGRARQADNPRCRPDRAFHR